ncbi:MAG: hypothetical protein M1823_002034 [Watsoniomyces obsoletus]|nr:MAG: hypothetical protein M1823_002034 [Watsoniomyces obsoletus]
MRLLAYAGTSTVLATGVILRAFHQRANFYSACVYLSQSNACLMILINLLLLLVCLTVFGLQRLLYGPLRPFEIEQLYEKAWFAITETCLAMTIFREEVGVWFLVMFVALLVGKVWSWIGRGRVDIVEQQPPANPRLFHLRLSFSLLLSVIYDVSMLRYAVGSVLRMARPNMMVMFAFEFAVLTVSSCATAVRYGLTLVELYTIHQQMKLKLEERRAQRRMAQAQQEADGSDVAPPATVPDELDEDDIDVPGWEAKRQWLLSLDLLTDFLKLVVYLAFFFILLAFYGLPIHIMRDVFLTLRSFVGRVGEFVGYRRATRDMNARYPDATAEEVAREDVCIICREEMRPWQTAGHAPAGDVPAGQEAAPTPTTRPTTSDERSRPKKLPCGHILHFSCLRRWLERQQICPTCRRPVMSTGPASATAGNPRAAIPPQAPMGAAGHHAQLPPLAGGLQQAGVQGVRPANRGRVFQLGPLRIGFGVGNGPVLQDLVQQMQNGAAGPAGNAPANPNRLLSFGMGLGRPPAAAAAGAGPAAAPLATLGGLPMSFATTMAVQLQLHQLEQQLLIQSTNLRITADQLRLLQTLQLELARLRQIQGMLHGIVPPSAIPSVAATHTHPQPATAMSPPSSASGTLPQPPANGAPGLPAGIALPPGWTLTPLYRLETTSDTSSTSVVPGTSHDDADTAESSQTTHQEHDSRPTPEPSSNEPMAGPSASTSADAPTSTHTATPSPRPTSQAPPTTHEPSTDSTDAGPSDADSPTSKTIPSWSSSTSNPFVRGTQQNHATSDQQEGSSSSASASHANGEASQPSNTSKGKARAVTVEDVHDDDDGD